MTLNAVGIIDSLVIAFSARSCVIAIRNANYPCVLNCFHWSAANHSPTHTPVAPYILASTYVHALAQPLDSHSLLLFSTVYHDMRHQAHLLTRLLMRQNPAFFNIPLAEDGFLCFREFEPIGGTSST